MSTIDQLASNIRAVAISELRLELRSIRSDEAPLVHLDGRSFVVITDDAWSDLVETASGHDDMPLMPT